MVLSFIFLLAGVLYFVRHPTDRTDSKRREKLGVMVTLGDVAAEGEAAEEETMAAPLDTGSGNTTAKEQTEPKENEVKLRVYDEGTQTEKEFFCDTKLLLAHMSYFKKYLNESDDTDILIHCDIYVFTWLMRYVKAQQREDLPALNDENCLPVLIASNFLEMATLVSECVSYIARRFLRLLRMPTDLNFLTQDLVRQLAEECTVETLEDVWREVEEPGRRPRGHKPGDRERQVSMGGEVKSLGARTLLDRLYEHKLDSLLERRGSELSYCVACRRLYCEELGAETFCPKAKVRVGLGGDVSAGHCPSRGLDVVTHLPALKQACHHRHLFWFFWSKLCTLRCTVCGERFAAADLKKCAYHPKKALYPPTELCGYYLCCKRDASKFDSLFGAVPARGCQHREHECDVAIMPSHVCEMVDLFRAQLTQSQAIYADLEAYDFGQAAVGNSGKDGPGEGAAEATASASGGGAPEQRALQPLVEANLRHYFAYVRNQSERSRRDEDVKLRLFGQTYQEAWQGQGEGTDRAQRGRRSILGDALQTLDCHRMKQSFITLTSRREDATVIES